METQRARAAEEARRWEANAQPALEAQLVRARTTMETRTSERSRLERSMAKVIITASTALTSSPVTPTKGITIITYSTLQEEEFPAPKGGWARCERHDEQLGPGAPRPRRRVSTTEYCD
eukprot:5697681-Pyramimonas_sp.AAC.2